MKLTMVLLLNILLISNCIFEGKSISEDKAKCLSLLSPLIFKLALEPNPSSTEVDSLLTLQILCEVTR